MSWGWHPPPPLYARGLAVYSFSFLLQFTSFMFKLYSDPVVWIDLNIVNLY